MGAAAEPHSGKVGMLAQYVQIACEEMRASPDSCVAVLGALLAVRSLRTDRGGGLDRIYLGSLGVPVATVFSEHQFGANSCRTRSAIWSRTYGAQLSSRRTLFSPGAVSMLRCGRRLQQHTVRRAEAVIGEAAQPPIHQLQKSNSPGQDRSLSLRGLLFRFSWKMREGLK